MQRGYKNGHGPREKRGAASSYSRRQIWHPVSHLDRSGSIAVRLEAYERSTEPLIQFYRNLGRLTVILASGSPEEIFARTVTALGEQGKQGKTPP